MKPISVLRAFPLSYFCNFRDILWCSYAGRAFPRFIRQPPQRGSSTIWTLAKRCMTSTSMRKTPIMATWHHGAMWQSAMFADGWKPQKDPKGTHTCALSKYQTISHLWDPLGFKCFLVNLLHLYSSTFLVPQQFLMFLIFSSIYDRDCVFIFPSVNQSHLISSQLISSHLISFPSPTPSTTLSHLISFVGLSVIDSVVPYPVLWQVLFRTAPF